MSDGRNRIFDELGRLATDAAGVARGFREEIESIVRTQSERVLRELDVVQREEFEAVREMAIKAREENTRLAERVAALETQLQSTASTTGTSSDGSA